MNISMEEIMKAKNLSDKLHHESKTDYDYSDPNNVKVFINGELIHRIITEEDDLKRPKKIICLPEENPDNIISRTLYKYINDSTVIKEHYCGTNDKPETITTVNNCTDFIETITKEESGNIKINYEYYEKDNIIRSVNKQYGNDRMNSTMIQNLKDKTTILIRSDKIYSKDKILFQYMKIIFEDEIVKQFICKIYDENMNPIIRKSLYRIEEISNFINLECIVSKEESKNGFIKKKYYTDNHYEKVSYSKDDIELDISSSDDGKILFLSYIGLTVKLSIRLVNTVPEDVYYVNIEGYDEDNRVKSRHTFNCLKHVADVIVNTITKEII